MTSVRLAFGSTIVLLGIVLLMCTLGLLSSAVAALNTLWPIALILSGMALIIRRRLLGSLFLLAAIILAIAAHLHPAAKSAVFIQQIQKENFETVKLDVHFGAGELTIGTQEQDAILSNFVRASREPTINLERDGNAATVAITSNSLKPETWNLTLDKSLPVDISLSYGAADADIDLSSVRASSLKISSGATDTHIKLPLYPTQVHIDTGASDLSLDFPVGVGAAIDVEGGAIDLDLDGFTYNNGIWINDWYGSRGSIEVDINAGAARIETSFYEAIE